MLKISKLVIKEALGQSLLNVMELARQNGLLVPCVSLVSAGVSDRSADKCIPLPAKLRPQGSCWRGLTFNTLQASVDASLCGYWPGSSSGLRFRRNGFAVTDLQDAG